MTAIVASKVGRARSRKPAMILHRLEVTRRLLSTIEIERIGVHRLLDVHSHRIRLHPDDGILIYASVAGQPADAIEHLRTAIELCEDCRGMARDDPDFDSIRDWTWKHLSPLPPRHRGCRPTCRRGVLARRMERFWNAAVATNANQRRTRSGESRAQGD